MTTARSRLPIGAVNSARAFASATTFLLFGSANSRAEQSPEPKIDVPNYSISYEIRDARAQQSLFIDASRNLFVVGTRTESYIGSSLPRSFATCRSPAGECSYAFSDELPVVRLNPNVHRATVGSSMVTLVGRATKPLPSCTRYKSTVRSARKVMFYTWCPGYGVTRVAIVAGGRVENDLVLKTWAGVLK